MSGGQDMTLQNSTADVTPTGYDLHLNLIDVDLLNRVRRTEAVLKHGAGAQVAQLGLDEGTQVAGRAVFDAENGVQIIVVLDDHAGTQLGGRDRHRLKNSPYTIAVEAGGRRAGPLVPPPAYYAKKAKALFYTELRRKRNLPEGELIEDEPDYEFPHWPRRAAAAGIE